MSRRSKKSRATLAEVRARFSAEERQALPASSKAQRALYESGAPWSEVDLERRGLPLYWSAEWLRAGIEAHGATGLSRASPYSRSVLAKWKAVHGIEDEDDTDRRIIEAWSSGEYDTQRQLAAAFGVGEQRVSIAVGQSRAVHDPALAERLEEVAAVRRAGAKNPAEAQRRLPHLTYQQVYRAWRRLKGHE